MHRQTNMWNFLARASLIQSAILTLAVLAIPAARAQNPIQVLDPSALHPANPTLKAAAAQYKIPWIRHDFLIPYHNWSRNAAINARWFDAKSKSIGDEYRDQVFANQRSIYNPDSLAKFTQQFAQSHGLSLPFAIDPQGKLANDVNADIALAQRTGVKSTPTIFVVEANGKGAPFTQVMKPAEQLYTVIDQAIADTASPAKSTVAKKSAGK
jgi:hypothetical protein